MRRFLETVLVGGVFLGAYAGVQVVRITFHWLGRGEVSRGCWE